ncbi:hypothetical protein AA313_de0206633 [Arthrobotrys entomopaga]|nr:hypothetical protein AA313_de0206633 [Arthrobotrys entomopaga]
MRITFLVLGLTAIHKSLGFCDCSNIAALTLNCAPTDSACICNSGNYLTVFNSCSETCSDEEKKHVTDIYNSACKRTPSTTSVFTRKSATTSVHIRTNAPTSVPIAMKIATTSISTKKSVTTSISTKKSATTSTSSSLHSTITSSSFITTSTKKTKKVAPTSSPSSAALASPSKTILPNTAPTNIVNTRPILSNKQIGGIAGGVAGLIIIAIISGLLLAHKKFKAAEKKADVERDVEVKDFVEGGRRLRAASTSSYVSDRMYSLRKPLSYTLGEYNSTNYLAG